MHRKQSACTPWRSRVLPRGRTCMAATLHSAQLTGGPAPLPFGIHSPLRNPQQRLQLLPPHVTKTSDGIISVVNSAENMYDVVSCSCSINSSLICPESGTGSCAPLFSGLVLNVFINLSEGMMLSQSCVLGFLFWISVIYVVWHFGVQHF